MRYEIKGDTLPVVICYLEGGEKMITEGGGMSWMSPNMKMETTTKMRCSQYFRPTYFRTRPNVWPGWSSLGLGPRPRGPGMVLAFSAITLRLLLVSVQHLQPAFLPFRLLPVLLRVLPEP